MHSLASSEAQAAERRRSGTQARTLQRTHVGAILQPARPRMGGRTQMAGDVRISNSENDHVLNEIGIGIEMYHSHRVNSRERREMVLRENYEIWIIAGWFGSSGHMK